MISSIILSNHVPLIPEEFVLFCFLFYHVTSCGSMESFFFFLSAGQYLYFQFQSSFNYSFIWHVHPVYTKLDKVGVTYIMPASPGKHCYKNNTQYPLRQIHGHLSSHSSWHDVYPLSQHDLPFFPAIIFILILQAWFLWCHLMISFILLFFFFSF